MQRYLGYESNTHSQWKHLGRCATMNLKRNYWKQSIAITSDRQAAIMALNSNTVSSKLLGECFERLNNLRKENRVVLYWVTEHTLISANEKTHLLIKNLPSLRHLKVVI